MAKRVRPQRRNPIDALDVAEAPEVRWRTSEDKSRFPNAKRTLEHARRVVHDTWKRIPKTERMFLHWPYRVHIMLIADEEGDLGQAQGDTQVFLNVAKARFGVNDRIEVTWTVAHELAHIFDTRLRMFAAFGVRGVGTHTKPRMQTELVQHKARRVRTVDLPAITPMQEALILYTLRYPLLAGTVGETHLLMGQEDQEDMADRQADAIAISWGFGWEFGFCHENILDDDPETIEDDTPGYLAPELASVLLGARLRKDKSLFKGSGFDRSGRLVALDSAPQMRYKVADSGKIVGQRLRLYQDGFERVFLKVETAKDSTYYGVPHLTHRDCPMARLLAAYSRQFLRGRIGIHIKSILKQVGKRWCNDCYTLPDGSVLNTRRLVWRANARTRTWR